MLQEVLKLKKHRVAAAAFIAVYGWLFLSIAVPSASALPIPKGNVHAIPAFARKYGMPCSSCHEAWPKLSPFGQQFKDNGYQMGNEKDAPIYQNPSYWPVSFRITPHWHRESVDHADITNPLPTGDTTEGRLTTHGFDVGGLDILTAGTLAKNISFLLVPAAENDGSFHFEAANVRFSNLLGSSWLNIKAGKFELDNIISEKRILGLSNNGGFYQMYHFQPVGEDTAMFTVGGELRTDGLGQKSFYRAGFNGLWYIKKFDVMTQYLHGLDNALLGTATPSYNPLPAGAHSPTWNAGLIEPHYNLNPQFILIGRYELIRMSRQALDTNAGNLGDIDAGTVGFRYYPFISSRAGFA